MMTTTTIIGIKVGWNGPGVTYSRNETLWLREPETARIVIVWLPGGAAYDTERVAVDVALGTSEEGLNLALIPVGKSIAVKFTA